MSESDFDTLSKSFRESFKSQPGAFLHPSLDLVDLRTRSRGRGMVATSEIPADATLFVIPRDYVLGVSSSGCPVQTDEDDEDDNDMPRSWRDMILVLMWEFLVVGRERSKWGPYLNVLPSRFDTLMFWDEKEVAELQASACRAKIGRADADRMFREKIVPVVRKWEEDSSIGGGAGSLEGLGDDQLLELAHRMGSLIMAYAFDLEVENAEADGENEDEDDGWTEDREGQMAMGMVPMADMLNADAEFNAHLEHGEVELTMRSLREIKRGEEVLNYYGPLPNSDLLRRYGYTSAKHARYDVVELGWDLVLKSMGEVLGSIPDVAIPDDEGEEIFVLERESGDPDETGVNRTEAKFTAFPEELVEQVTTFVSAALNIPARPTELQKRKLKQKFLQTMEKALAARLAEYGTSIERDEGLLRPDSTTSRLRMAVDVRLGEKRLLREAQALVAELLRKYADRGENGTATSGHPAKKQKTKR